MNFAIKVFGRTKTLLTSERQPGTLFKMKRKFAYQKVYGSTNVHIIELCTKKAFDRKCEFLLSPKHI